MILADKVLSMFSQLNLHRFTFYWNHKRTQYQDPPSLPSCLESKASCEATKQAIHYWKDIPLSFNMPSQAPRKKMEERVEKKPPRINVIRQIKITDLNMDHLKKHSHVLESPTTSKAVTLKSSSERWNCLCSPTTHVGSFRCRRHRSANGMHRARSVGSNLSALASKDSFSFYPQ